VVNGMDRDREIGRDQEGRESLLEDEQMSVWGAILQEKNFRLRKRNATKASGRCKYVAAWLMLRISMPQNETDFEYASGLELVSLVTRIRPGREQRVLVQARNPKGQNCGKAGKAEEQQIDGNAKNLCLEKRL
jgi:hypothetical protein